MSSLSIDGFEILGSIGRGGYGEIYYAKKEGSTQIYALKTENTEASQTGLSNELEIVKCLPDKPCFPKLVTEGTTSSFHYFAMPLYGPTLSSLREKFPNKCFSPTTSIKIGIETLSIIEELHKTGIVHCDIKPSNFVIDQFPRYGLVLIDYGLSNHYIDSTGAHIKENKVHGYKGTMNYFSVNVHKLITPTRRDDLISWFYSLLELSKGKLPWNDIHDQAMMMSTKQSIAPDKLCSGQSHFISIWEIISKLGFDETPPYQKIHQLLLDISPDCMTSRYEWETNPQILQDLTPYPELFQQKVSIAEPRTRRCLVQ